jgi:hypothetical protein
MPDANSNLRITVMLRAASKPGLTKAFADVVIDTGSSKIEVFGLSVIKRDSEKPAWVSYPQRPGKDGKKIFSHRSPNRSTWRKSLRCCLTRVGANAGSDGSRRCCAARSNPTRARRRSSVLRFCELGAGWRGTQSGQRAIGNLSTRDANGLTGQRPLSPVRG